jgi:hypothetical protein
MMETTTFALAIFLTYLTGVIARPSILGSRQLPEHTLVNVHDLDTHWTVRCGKKV